MNPEDFDYFKSRVSRFISGTSSRSKLGSFGGAKVFRLSRFVPKRPIPQQVLSKFSGSSDSIDESIGAPKRVVSSLGRLTLDLEVINNNLDRIREIILQDYKNTQEVNKKETEDYRKRIANRGRIFGKRELGDKKSDVLGTVKKYVGSFFSGTGGAIRALAMFNLLQGILSGDPSKIIGPLLGIGLTYLPAIGAGIAGAVATSLTKRLFGLGGRAAAPAAASAGAGAGPRMGGMRGFAGRAALFGGGIALANSLLNKPDETDQPSRLEEVTQQQKALVAPENLTPIPKDDLKKFETINKKFEEALDILIKKQKEQQTRPQQPSSGGGGGGGGGGGRPISGPAPTEINALMSAISGGEGGLESVNRIGAMPGLSQMTIDQAIAKVESLRERGETSGAMGNMQQKSYYLRERAIAAGLDPSTALYNQENQYKINRAYLASLFSGGEQEIVNLIRAGKINEVVNKLKGVWPSLPGGSQENVHTSSFYRNFQNYMSQLGSSSVSPAQMLTPSRRGPRTIPAPSRQSPNITLVPAPMGGESSQGSVSNGGNSTVPSISTSYPENFLSMYSKLIYQVV